MAAQESVPPGSSATPLAALAVRCLATAVGKGNPLATTLGAGAGVLASEVLQAGSNAAQQLSYVTGYEKGQSDTAKRQWQALYERQRFAPQSEDAAHVRTSEVPLPERQVNGVLLAPATPRPVSTTNAIRY